MSVFVIDLPEGEPVTGRRIHFKISRGLWLPLEVRHEMISDYGGSDCKATLDQPRSLGGYEIEKRVVQERNGAQSDKQG